MMKVASNTETSCRMEQSMIGDLKVKLVEIARISKKKFTGSERVFNILLYCDNIM